MTVANPTGRQLNRGFSPPSVSVGAQEFGLARWIRPFRPALARSFSTRDSSRLPRRRPHTPSTAIRPVPSLSGHATAYRWRSLPRVRRHRASQPQGSSSNGCCFFGYHHRTFFYVSLFFPHTLLTCSRHVCMCDNVRKVSRDSSVVQTTVVCLQRKKLLKFSEIYLCVCVCCHPIFSGRQVCGRTSRGHTGGRPHRIFHPPSFCGTCLNFSREKDPAVPFPRRPLNRVWCTNYLIVLHLLGM